MHLDPSNFCHTECLFTGHQCITRLELTSVICHILRSSALWAFLFRLYRGTRSLALDLGVCCKLWYCRSFASSLFPQIMGNTLTITCSLLPLIRCTIIVASTLFQSSRTFFSGFDIAILNHAQGAKSLESIIVMPGHVPEPKHWQKLIKVCQSFPIRIWEKRHGFRTL